MFDTMFEIRNADLYLIVEEMKYREVVALWTGPMVT